MTSTHPLVENGEFPKKFTVVANEQPLDKYGIMMNCGLLRRLNKGGQTYMNIPSKELQGVNHNFVISGRSYISKSELCVTQSAMKQTGLNPGDEVLLTPFYQSLVEQNPYLFYFEVKKL